jgi:hypothetical protein
MEIDPAGRSAGGIAFWGVRRGQCCRCQPTLQSGRGEGRLTALQRSRRHCD